MHKAAGQITYGKMYKWCDLIQESFLHNIHKNSREKLSVYWRNVDYGSNNLFSTCPLIIELIVSMVITKRVLLG